MTPTAPESRRPAGTVVHRLLSKPRGFDGRLDTPVTGVDLAVALDGGGSMAAGGTGCDRVRYRNCPWRRLPYWLAADDPASRDLPMVLLAKLKCLFAGFGPRIAWTVRQAHPGRRNEWLPLVDWKTGTEDARRLNAVARNDALCTALARAATRPTSTRSPGTLVFFDAPNCH